MPVWLPGGDDSSGEECSAARERESGPTGPDSAEAGASAGTVSCMRLVHDIQVTAMDVDGAECKPTRCAKAGAGSSECSFAEKGWHVTGKQAFTMQGPASLRHRQYICTTHGSVVSAKVSHRQYFAPRGTLKPDLIQLGEVRENSSCGLSNLMHYGNGATDAPPPGQCSHSIHHPCLWRRKEQCAPWALRHPYSTHG